MQYIYNKVMKKHKELLRKAWNIERSAKRAEFHAAKLATFTLILCALATISFINADESAKLVSTGALLFAALITATFSVKIFVHRLNPLKRELKSIKREITTSSLKKANQG